jgi:poly-gamma-glutamate synthesis protein (capsule biosynthesis protein)
LKKENVKLIAVGDIFLGRLVDEVISQNGPDFLFERIKQYLKGDIVFANLETPLSFRGVPNTNKSCILLFKGNPIVADALKRAGFNILSLANNHIFDYGFEGFKDTIDILNKTSITHVGVGCNLEESRLVKIIEVKGVKIGFLAYSYSYHAGLYKPGCAPMTMKVIESDIRKAKSKVDILVVSFHNGIEFSHYPTLNMRKIAKKAVDSGAHLVLGHHPHTIQGIERYNKAVIVYSLGNFVFDFANEGIRAWAYSNSEVSIFGESKLHTDDLRAIESIIFECEFSSEGVECFKAIPIKIDKYHRPYVPGEEEGMKILERLDDISKPLSCDSHPVWGEVRVIQEKKRRCALHNLSFSQIIFMLPRFSLDRFKFFLPYLILKVKDLLRGKSFNDKTSIN